jgi:hypothetical protein
MVGSGIFKMEFNGVFFYSAWSQCQMIAKLSPPPAWLLLPTLGRVLLHHIWQVVVSVYLIMHLTLTSFFLFLCVYIQPVQEKYAQLAFKEPVTLLPSLGQPVQYSVVHPSTKGPPPPVPPPHSSSQPPRAPEGDKHPLGSLLFLHAK